MGVDQRTDRSRADSPFLTEMADEDGVARVVDAVRALRSVDGLIGGSGEVDDADLPARRGAARSHEQWASPQAVLQEFEQHMARALGGDAASARRIAELYETLREQELADAWWRKAAALGDGDAIDYVRYTLS